MGNSGKHLIHSLVLIICFILFCFQLVTLISGRQQRQISRLALKKFKSCLAKTNIDVSYPSNETWWYDSQSYLVVALKHPIAVAYAESTSDVQKLVKCATARKLKIDPRSGGHSYESFSNEDNHFVIDVSRIANVNVSEDGETATIGAGIRVGRLTYLLGQRQRAFPNSPDTTIGLGGHVAAGGIGFLMRLWGLSIDNVLELEMVDYRGHVLVANDATNKDLFFALRGGGGGSYGIVTQMKLKVFSYPPLSTSFTIRWNQPISSSDFSKAWFKWRPWDTIPPGMAFYIYLGKTSIMLGMYVGEDGHVGLGNILNASGFLQLGPEGSQEYRYYESDDFLKTRAWLDNNNAGKSNDSSIRVYNTPTSFVYQSLNLPPYPNPVPPTYVPIQRDPRVNATHSENSIESMGPNPDMEPWLITRAYEINTNQIFINEFNETAYAAMDEYIQQNNGKMAFMPFGGVLSTYADDYNAYPHRKQPFFGEFHTAYFPAGTQTVSGVHQQREASNKILKAMEPFTNHRSYQGVPDLFWTTNPENYMPRYYGENVKRLVRAKATYDPEDVFCNAQSTPTTL